jgi:methylmalonyl-CoA/ethylmalonyl-CoA epimerase
MGVDRVVIAVRDIDTAAKRYSELLGISFPHSVIREDYGIRAMVSWDGGIELVSPIDNNSLIAKFIEKKGEGLFGVVFKVDDIDKAKARAEAKGFRVTGDVHSGLPDGFKLFKEITLHPKDTYGISTTLMQSERG